MTYQEIKDKTRDILVEVLEHDQFMMNEDLTAADVDGWDSLNHMVIISAIEESFGIKFKLREISKLNCVGDLLQLIEMKVKENN
jgi:acyl carrier protein